MHLVLTHDRVGEGSTGVGAIKNFPFIYLGAPLHKGRSKSEYFEHLVQMVNNKLEGWKAKFMSFAGKITVLKSVLASIPIHTLSCMAVPKSVVNRLENLMKASYGANTVREDSIGWPGRIYAARMVKVG